LSGSTIGGIVGGTIGFFVGSPQLGFMIGSAIGGYLKPDQIEGPRLNDAQVQTSQEGVPRPIVYGTAQVAGNLIQRGPLVERKKKERAGKGGPEQITYHYYMTYAIRICEGPIAGIRRIWRDDKLVYSLREGDFIDADSAAFASKLTIYLGDDAQLPDPSLEALPAENGGGAGKVPSYRGTAYVVFENDDLTERRGTVPQYRFEVVSAGEATAGHGGVTWLATDGQGRFQKSLGGTDWTTLPNYTASALGNSLLYGGGVVVASDSIDTRYSLDEGDTWAVSTFNAGAGQYTGFHGAYISGQFWVAQSGSGADGHSVARSGGGSSFTQVYPGIAGSTISITGRPGLMVVGYNWKYVAVSKDGGQTWGSRDLSAQYTQCVGTNGTRVMVLSGPDAAYARYTDDGDTFSSWVTANITEPHACVGTGSLWVAAGNSGISYSLNGGDSWTAATLPGAFHGMDVKHSGGLFVAVGSLAGAGTGTRILTSTDGINWTERAHNFPSGSSQVTSVVPITCHGVPAPDSPGFFVTLDGGVCGGSLGSITADTITVGQIVSDLLERVGIPTAKLDISELTDVVTGFVVARQMPAAEAIRALQNAYRFDMPEWDKKIRGIKRGGANKGTITDDDLVGDEEETRAQAVEFPRKFNLITADPDANYEPVTITSSRPQNIVKSQNEVTTELPVIFSGPDERAQVCDILHKVAWAEMEGRLTIEIPEEWTWLTPSDCFAFNSKRWRAEKTELLDGSMKVDAVRDRASAYTSSANGQARNPTAPVSSIRGPTILRAMNLPRLRTQDDKPGIYLAATGLLPAWDGCQVFMSVDGGLTEQWVATIIARATMGDLVHGIDEDDEPITVRLYDNRELESIAPTQARLNGFAITTDEVSEVGRFLTATEATHWELTDVSRGELGTQAAPHDPGDPFVLLDEAVVFVPLSSSLMGQEIILRAVTFGTANANNETITITFDPLFTGPEVIKFLLTESNVRMLAEDGAYLLEE
jgi:hypothetical protein